VWDRALEALRAVPGTRAVAIATNLPFQTPVWSPRVERVDQPGEASSAGIPGYSVTPNFFATAGIPIVRGRAFDASDRTDSHGVAIVNRAFERAFLANRDPIGARLRILSDWNRGDWPDRELEVVGVAGDVVQGRVEDGIVPALYVPYTQSIMGLAQILLATDRDVEGVTADIRRAAATVVPFPVMELSSMESRISATQTSPRFQLFLIGAFAIAAVLLSAIGLYGTLAFSVRARFKELGIRMAIGADRRSIFGLVLRQGMVVLAMGLVTGLVAALGLTRVLQSFLFRVRPIDPLAFLIGIAIICAAALLAVLRPAARAARIDPLSSIRVEG
ncbi:MAG: FtsX-like permease family protein, partial [Longimicrobiales bacterium]